MGVVSKVKLTYYEEKDFSSINVRYEWVGILRKLTGYNLTNKFLNDQVPPWKYITAQKKYCNTNNHKEYKKNDKCCSVLKCKTI